MKLRKLSVLTSLVILILMAGLSQSQAQTTNVTIHNYATSYLTLYDVTTGGTPDPLVPPNGAATTYSLNTTHTYTLEHYFYQNAGHAFSFSAGQVVPGGNAPVTSEFFTTSGNDIVVSGVQFTIKLISGTPELLYGAGSFAAPFGLPSVGGPDYVVNLIPADKNFNGTYDFTFAIANGATVQLGTNGGVASVTGSGTTFLANVPYGVRVQLSDGNVMEFTALPEPSSMFLGVLTAALCFAIRLRRAK